MLLHFVTDKVLEVFIGVRHLRTDLMVADDKSYFSLKAGFQSQREDAGAFKSDDFSYLDLLEEWKNA